METTITISTTTFWTLFFVGIIAGVAAGMITYHLHNSGELKED